MHEKRLKEIRDRLAAINARKLEIRGLLTDTTKQVDLGALQTELGTLDTEARGLTGEQEAIELRQQVAAGINAGTIAGNPIPKPGEQRQTTFENMPQEERLATPEYRSAFLKNLQGKSLTEVERRAITTAAGSGGATVPTTTLNLIVQKLQQTSVLFSQITVSYVPGNLSIVVANAKNAAQWKNEGADSTTGDDTFITVSLGGYELIKTVDISAATDAMAIDAFESYIADEIGRQLAIAIENAIINGAGTGQPTGILTGITWSATNSATWGAAADVEYDDIVGLMALLPTMYHQKACFCMNRPMLFNGVRKIKDQYGHPIFVQNTQAAQPMNIMGYPVLVDDYIPDNTILFCDHSYYYLNFSKAPEISADRSVGFKSGKVVYRGLAVLDGKPALAEAFTKLSKASAS